MYHHNYVCRENTSDVHWTETKAMLNQTVQLLHVIKL